MAQVQVLVDEKGNVLGTAHANHPTDGGPSAPSRMGMQARPGQRVMEITVDDKTALLDPAALHAAIQKQHIKK